MPRANEYLNRVEGFYLLHRAAAPAGLEVQHAWLLYNTQNDRSLYSFLLRLDVRPDLTPAQRGELDRLWASWAVRRAFQAMDAGNLLRGVKILQAASQDYPDNMDVRRAVAGAYAKVGKASDSVALFKSIPMQDATSGDLQSAIGAALAAPDLPQAEIWLRQALGSFPADPRILSLAARFEQARGNNQRATDYWRASLAAMPPGSAAEHLDSGVVNSPSSFETTSPAGLPHLDLKRLLDPREDTSDKSGKLPPLPSYPSSNNHPPSAPGLRITLQPVSETPEQTQARFADPLDFQLTQGSSAPASAAQIRPIPNATVSSPSPLGQGPTASTPSGPSPAVPAQYTIAQFTPSAQDAAAGAYSASRPQSAQPPPEQPAAKPAARKSKPAAATRTGAARKASQKKPSGKKTAASRASKSSASAPTLESAPTTEQGLQPGQVPQSATLGTSMPPATEAAAFPADQTQATPPPDANGTGLTDEQLQQRDLPPLRGPWIRIQRGVRQIDPRAEAEMQLRRIESGYSSWWGGAGFVNYRSGALGFDHLTVLEAPFEISMPLGYNARFTFVAKPVFLDSGQADGTSTITVQEFLAGKSSLVPIPQPIGTLTSTAINPPAQQNAVGVGGEFQLAFPHLAFAAGYTPAGFLVATFTGRAQWKPADGPFTFNFVRDPVKDSQLSYAGLRDPNGATLGTFGQAWGGVMANQGNVQFAHGDAESGFYFGLGGQYLAGYHVQTNLRFDGSGGAYWRVKTVPEYGNLSIGANFFAMHYTHNENAFTLGMGGYFSPQAYFLANLPVSWAGHYQTRWHYNVMGSFGVQGFQQSLTPLFPLAAQSAFEIALNNPMLPAKTSVGPNYDLRGQMSYQIGPHWFAGGFFSANNSRGYDSVSAGFSIHYMFRAQPSTADGPTGLFPTDGLRPFRVP
jgi:hypothetical protein